MDEQRIYRAALAAWGADAQTLMVFEEMAELQKELCKAASFPVCSQSRNPPIAAFTLRQDI